MSRCRSQQEDVIAADAPSPTRREALAAIAGWTAVGSLEQIAHGQSQAAPSNQSPADGPLAAPPPAADLGTLFPVVDRLAAGNTYRSAYDPTRDGAFPAYAAKTRTRLLDLLLYRPAPVEPAPRVLERRDCGEYIRERIEFATSPATRVPAYVLIPKGLRPGTRAPAIVDLHSHGGMFLFGKEKVIDLGNNHPVMVEYHRQNYAGRPTATELVRRGFVVISIDAFMFGERRVLLAKDAERGWNRADYSVETAQTLNAVCRSKESTIVKGLTLAGLTWPGVVFWDDIRTVDYLVSRPEVDPERIGCVGISMGGYRSLYLTALDPRIRAGCVVGFMSSVRPMIQGHLDTHSFVHFLPALHQELDWPDVAGLAADRALCVQQCRHDKLFPLSGMEESLERIQTIFRQAGREREFLGKFYDEPHRFSLAMQDEAFAWLGEKL